MLCERPGRGKSAVDLVRKTTWSTCRTKNGPGERARAGRKTCLRELPLAGVERKLLRTNHLTVQRAGNERLALDFAGLAIGDGDAIDFECASHGALVIGLGFGEIGLGAVLGERDVGVAHVEQRGVLHLLQLRLEPTLR